ncbi:hypothetical protein HWV62_45609 [Athelia sp. TMB]|nr:hypothetical protein HWV62_45609 [Athelia sp. TMB]
MHLVRHARPSLIRTSTLVHAALVPQRHRPYSIETATAVAELAETAPQQGEFIVTETKPIPGPSTSFKARKRTRLATEHLEKVDAKGAQPRGQLSRTLHKRQEVSRQIQSEEESNAVISSVKNAIEQDHASQEDVLKTLQQALSSVPESKKKKKKKKKKKVDTAESLAGIHEDVATTLSQEGWKAEEWSGKSDWGLDKLTPPKPKKKASVKAPPLKPPPHQLPPLKYSRRIEGLLRADDGPTLTDLESPHEAKPVAELAHGLDRVLFNPGVHWLQDPRSGVYNFPTWLENIPNVKDFAFDRVTGFVRSSADDDLRTLARQEGRQYTGSTSSLTGVLSHIYFLLSNFRDVNTSMLSRNFQKESATFTAGQRMPTTLNLMYKDGIYAFDSQSSDLSEKNVLTWMGTMLEKFLTAPKEEFQRYLRSAPELAEDEIDTRREAYRYSKASDHSTHRFVMRSQLDGVDKRLPGSGVFDIKTRAAVPIRLDLLNYEENSGYLIRTLQGPMESFEKEYFDLIRSAFLKYSFQVRIGNMDGVIVAYHNTARLFGFQYVPLEEMDACIFGEAGRGDRVFQKCVRLMEELADEIVRVYPQQSVKCTIETQEDGNTMSVWIEPLEWDETSKGPCPITQLDMEATSYIDEQEVTGTRAISAEGSWTVHWKLSRISAPEDDIRMNLAACRDRQFRAWALPSGISVEDMAEHWDTLKFGENAKDVAFNPAYVQSPGFGIQKLRELARTGREDTEKLTIENAGKAKVVWGVVEDAVTRTESEKYPLIEMLDAIYPPDDKREAKR